MSDSELIREFERDILDRHHESYKFFDYSQDIVIPYLLQVVGDTERFRDELVNGGHTETNIATYLSNMMHGLGHCIRWLINRKPELQVKEDFDGTYSEVHEMAADFLGWGTGYHMIAQEFITWSRAIKKAVLNSQEKWITFYNPDGFDYSKIYGKQLLFGTRMQSVFNSYPHEIMESEFSIWLKDVDLKNPPIANHIRWERAKTSQSYPLLYFKLCELLFPELEETTDFDGYNLRELRQFYTLVFLNFHFIRWVEGHLDSSAQPKNLSFGSNPLEFNPGQLQKFIAVLTGLDECVSKNIIIDLTFNPSNFHSSVTIQPFILSSQDIYYILPNLFVQLEPLRMIIGALNKGNKKKRYDNLINIIEKANLKIIHERLKQIKNCSCYIEKSIKFDGRQYTPDIILTDFQNKVLLVADYKHFIGPITASEVDYKMKELKKAITQVSGYVQVLSKVAKLGSADITGFLVQGIIVTHKPLPIPVPNENVLPVIDLESFLFIVDQINNEDCSVGDLGDKIISENASEPKFQFEIMEASIKVSDWLIKRTEHRIVGNNN
jgi:hypothetical protein